MADRRPDLEAAPFKDPGYLYKVIAPPQEVFQKAGTFYYSDIQTDVTAQTGRTLGNEPTSTLLTSEKVSFDLTQADEDIGRIKIPKSEIPMLGGLERAHQVGTRRGKRGIGANLEAAVIAATFGDAANLGPGGAQSITTSFLKQLDIAKEFVMDRGDGKVVVFGARRIIGRLKRYDEIVERMKFTGVLLDDVRDVRSISDEQLAAALGVDMVLAGPSDASASGWLGAASAYDGYCGVMVAPDPNVDAMEEIQFARTPTFMPGDAGNVFEIETFYSDEYRSEVVDVTAYSEVLALNKELCYIMSGIDEENTVTT